MGFLAAVTEPLRAILADRSTIFVLGAGLFAFAVITIVANVFQQLLFKSSNEPPMVFHWVPFIGSTITYGIDPYKFFFSCREKVIDSFAPTITASWC